MASTGGQAGAKHLRRLLDSMLVVGSELDLPTVLERIVTTALELVGAQYGALGVLDASHERLAEFITVGLTDDQRAAIGNLPEGHGILGLLIVDPRPIRLPDLSEHPDSFGFPPNHPKMTSFLGVPIRVRGQVFGNLYLCDKEDAEVFTDVDEELAVTLAAAAGVAIDNARLHAQVANIAMFEDRERIARELHDTVIQRLFATGLGLQGIARMIGNAELTARLEQYVDDLDTTIKQVRTAIFELHTARAPGRSLRQEILALVAESARSLGFEPTVRFGGPIDTLVDDDLADDVLAVLRESLANCARHAKAQRVEVRIDASGADGFVLLVEDDGVGPGDKPLAGRGLGNMAQRAKLRHGDAVLAPGSDGGSSLRWSVPLSGG